MKRIPLLFAVMLGFAAPQAAVAQTAEERQAELQRKKEEARKKAEERKAAAAAAAASGGTSSTNTTTGTAGTSTTTSAGGAATTASGGAATGGTASTAAKGGAGGSAGTANTAGSAGKGGAAAVEKDPPLPSGDIEALRRDRPERRKATVERLRQRWGSVLTTDKGLADLKLHARRVAFLQRIRAVAETKKDAKTVEAVDVLLTQEDERHAKAMNSLREGALPSGTSQ